MGKVAQIPAPSEHTEQCVVIEWWAHVCSKYGLPVFALFAVPNGAKLQFARNKAGNRYSIEAARLLAEGMRPGVPDLFLASGSQSDTAAHGLFLEMKRKPNKPTPEQEAVLAYLRTSGYHAVICWNADEAMRAITGYLKP